MTFVKAEPADTNNHKSRPIASIRLFDNGNCTITLPAAFMAQYLPNLPRDTLFSVSWGTGPEEGKVMVGALPDSHIKPVVIKGCVMLNCRKPRHAPPGRRAGKDCKVLSFKDLGVMMQLPNWKA